MAFSHGKFYAAVFMLRVSFGIFFRIETQNNLAVVSWFFKFFFFLWDCSSEL